MIVKRIYKNKICTEIKTNDVWEIFRFLHFSFATGDAQGVKYIIEIDKVISGINKRGEIQNA